MLPFHLLSNPSTSLHPFLILFPPSPTVALYSPHFLHIASSIRCHQAQLMSHSIQHLLQLTSKEVHPYSSRKVFTFQGLTNGLSCWATERLRLRNPSPKPVFTDRLKEQVCVPVEHATLAPLICNFFKRNNREEISSLNNGKTSEPK